MIQCGHHISAVAIIAAIVFRWQPALGADELDYQKRGNRHEGVRPKPVSGFNIELLSARVDYLDKPDSLGERFHAKFFLERPSDVFITVRELDYRRYYWLDRVEPKSPWRTGFGNEFDWPTSDVLGSLDLRISDLGIVARVGKSDPAADEQVVPVVFYQSQLPNEVKGYVFSFRLREDSKITATVYGSGAQYMVQELGKVRGGRPFTFKWNLASKAAPRGRVQARAQRL